MQQSLSACRRLLLLLPCQLLLPSPPRQLLLHGLLLRGLPLLPLLLFIPTTVAAAAT